MPLSSNPPQLYKKSDTFSISKIQFLLTHKVDTEDNAARIKNKQNIFNIYFKIRKQLKVGQGSFINDVTYGWWVQKICLTLGISIKT